MGKSNKKNRGHQHDEDRGDDKQAAFRSFGGGGIRHSGTVGGSLGRPERHSEEHFKMIVTMQDLRKKADLKEKALAVEAPDYPAYIAAKRQMLELEKKLRLVPAFVEYQKMRMDLRVASTAFETAKADPYNGQRPSYYSLVALCRHFSYAS